MFDGEGSNLERAGWGQAAVDDYARRRAALGREPTGEEEVQMALAACAAGARFYPEERDRAHLLGEDRELAEGVVLDLLANVLHAADGLVVPQLLVTAVAAVEQFDEQARTEDWRRLGPGRGFGEFLVAVRHALVTVHDLDFDGMLESAVQTFHEEAEEERFHRVAAERAR
ncbi:hypothetical protein [Streptomyces ipomoeae]|uniref:hypothetical protein n=1 Tax=Streptomyces ipomoeae TaxID=103232 RepID=UPI001146D120|nr:hypothetical protein [Streptomyces ipomoeae]TQE33037.1 hypothetical protein Sipo7851_21270 [Streptomyces ipomoeae]